MCPMFSKCITKICFILGLVVSCNGCFSSQRIAGQTCGGEIYKCVEETSLFRKFYVKTGNILDRDYMADRYPEIFSTSTDGIPVEVNVDTVKFVTDEKSLLSKVILCLIFQNSHSIKLSEQVHIYVGEERKKIPHGESLVIMDCKTSFLPIAEIPYRKKECFQINKFFDSKSGWWDVDKCTVRKDIIGLCVVLQLQRYAMKELTMPNIRFEFEEGNSK